MFMRWTALAFLHWKVPAAILEPHVPAGLELDTFGGSAWLGIVPFRMERVHARWLPPIPGAANFPELNLRTYVRGGGRTGVLFFSLDAASCLAVVGARAALNLPYMAASMDVVVADDGGVRYRSLRSHSGERRAEFVASYRPVGEVYHPAAGTLDHWLTERYALFGATRAGKTYALDIHHEPWPLQRGEAVIERSTLAVASGLDLPEELPLVHYAERQDVLAWWRTFV